MKKHLMTLLSYCFVAISLSACGGGGGGSAPPVPTTKVVLSAYLFGTMSSSTANVTAIDATVKVPFGVLVNYSSPVPANPQQHVFPLRSGAITFSGALSNSTTNAISGSYNDSTGVVAFSIPIPLSNSSIPALRSSINGYGTEFAKLYFKLATADSNTPFQPSNTDLTYFIKQTDPPSFDVPARGCELKFNALYQ
jgi:hypothetical protein